MTRDVSLKALSAVSKPGGKECSVLRVRMNLIWERSGSALPFRNLGLWLGIVMVGLSVLNIQACFAKNPQIPFESHHRHQTRIPSEFNREWTRIDANKSRLRIGQLWRARKIYVAASGIPRLVGEHAVETRRRHSGSCILKHKGIRLRPGNGRAYLLPLLIIGGGGQGVGQGRIA